MKTRKCDFCEKDIPNKEGVSVGENDLCGLCLEDTLKAICKTCGGTGVVRVKDHEASDAQASCGESRIEYRTVKCRQCN